MFEITPDMIEVFREQAEKDKEEGDGEFKITGLHPDCVIAMCDEINRFNWFLDYFVGTRTDLDDGILACKTANEIKAFIDKHVNKQN